MQTMIDISFSMWPLLSVTGVLSTDSSSLMQIGIRERFFPMVWSRRSILYLIKKSDCFIRRIIMLLFLSMFTSYLKWSMRSFEYFFDENSGNPRLYPGVPFPSESIWYLLTSLQRMGTENVGVKVTQQIHIPCFFPFSTSHDK